MNYDNFLRLTKESKPPAELLGIELVLWHAMKNNWDMAHNIVQDISTNSASWIHAYLHRFEGDSKNANYWYSRAGKKSSSESLQVELNNIIKSIFK